jgi:hypothetical protein
MCRPTNPRNNSVIPTGAKRSGGTLCPWRPSFLIRPFQSAPYFGDMTPGGCGKKYHSPRFWEGPDFSPAAKSLKMRPRFSPRDRTATPAPFGSL